MRNTILCFTFFTFVLLLGCNERLPDKVKLNDEVKFIVKLDLGTGKSWVTTSMKGNRDIVLAPYDLINLEREFLHEEVTYRWHAGAFNLKREDYCIFYSMKKSAETSKLLFRVVSNSSSDIEFDFMVISQQGNSSSSSYKASKGSTDFLLGEKDGHLFLIKSP